MATIVCDEKETRLRGPWPSRQEGAGFDSPTAECPTAEEPPGMTKEYARVRDELAGLREEHARLREERSKVVEELARLREELEPQKQVDPKEKLPNTLTRSGKEIIGESAALRAVLEKVETVAPTNST